MAKDSSWKKYGEELSKLCKKSMWKFYRSLKAIVLLDEPFNPTSVISDKEGNPWYDFEEFQQRLEEYFKDLLNPIRQNYKQISTHAMTYLEQEEPIIMEEEVSMAARSSPK